MERYQVLDQLHPCSSDKSLVGRRRTAGAETRYRLLETGAPNMRWRNSASSGEADAVRSRPLRLLHVDGGPARRARPRTDYGQRLDQAEVEMDNLRSALGWNLETSDTERAFVAGVVAATVMADAGDACWKAGHGSIPLSPKTI